MGNFDQIVKEAIWEVSPVLLEINAMPSDLTPMGTELQGGRRVDYLGTDEHGYIYHLEVQTIRSNLMPFRMFEYLSQIVRTRLKARYKDEVKINRVNAHVFFGELDIRQRLLHLTPSSQKAGLERSGSLFYSYDQTCIGWHEHQKFLASDKALDVAIAVLAKGGRSPGVMRQIMERVVALSRPAGEQEVRRRISQAYAFADLARVGSEARREAGRLGYNIVIDKDKHAISIAAQVAAEKDRELTAIVRDFAISTLETFVDSQTYVQITEVFWAMSEPEQIRQLHQELVAALKDNHDIAPILAQHQAALGLS